MTSIESLTLEVPDPTAASALYTAAFGLDNQVGLRGSEAPTTGFRGFTLSLVVSRPATVDGLIGAALDAGATPLKLGMARSFGGNAGVCQDGVGSSSAAILARSPTRMDSRGSPRAPYPVRLRDGSGRGPPGNSDRIQQLR